MDKLMNSYELTIFLNKMWFNKVCLQCYNTKQQNYRKNDHSLINESNEGDKKRYSIGRSSKEVQVGAKLVAQDMRHDPSPGALPHPHFQIA